MEKVNNLWHQLSPFLKRGLGGLELNETYFKVNPHNLLRQGGVSLQTSFS
jgi:hypothetical protein